eukprot:669631-Rhodomonas_salina.1
MAQAAVDLVSSAMVLCAWYALSGTDKLVVPPGARRRQGARADCRGKTLGRKTFGFKSWWYEQGITPTWAC